MENNTNKPLKLIYPEDQLIAFVDMFTLNAGLGGLTLDFSQATVSEGISMVISRIGMSKENVKLLAQALNQALQYLENIENQKATE